MVFEVLRFGVGDDGRSQFHGVSFSVSISVAEALVVFIWGVAMFFVEVSDLVSRYVLRMVF